MNDRVVNEIRNEIDTMRGLSMFKYINSIQFDTLNAKRKGTPLTEREIGRTLENLAAKMVREFHEKVQNVYKNEYTITFASAPDINFGVKKIDSDELIKEEKKIKEVMAELNKIYAGQFKFDYKKD
jgi:hypothetical protein